MELEPSIWERYRKRYQRLHYSYMELELAIISLSCPILFITLFLYGIGAIFLFQLYFLKYKLHYSYMELEPCFIPTTIQSSSSLHYSYMELELSQTFPRLMQHIQYYIIPIWNWSQNHHCKYPQTLLILHYSYMELEPC